jgi:hypothetical protein
MPNSVRVRRLGNLQITTLPVQTDFSFQAIAKGVQLYLFSLASAEDVGE